MTDLQTEFDRISALQPQQRGRAFEHFLGQVFEQESIRHRLSYRPAGEEIDGAFWWTMKTFLLEAKWVQDPIPASSIYAFKGKVEGKFDGTLGVFVSMSGYSKDCVQAISTGKNLNILLFDDTDVEAITNGELFSTVLEEKMFAAGQTGRVYLPWSELKETQEVIRSLQQPTSTTLPLVVLCEGPTDKVVLDHFISHVATTESLTLEPKFLISYGKQGLLQNWAPAVASLVSTGVTGPMALLVAFDADTTDPFDIQTQRHRMEQALKDLPESWRTHVAVASPEVETWIESKARLKPPEATSHLENIKWSDQISKQPELKQLFEFLKGLK